MLHQCCLGDEQGPVLRAAVGEVHKDEDGSEDEFCRWIRGPIWLGQVVCRKRCAVVGGGPVVLCAGCGWCIGCGGRPSGGLGPDFGVKQFKEAAGAKSCKEMVNHLARRFVFGDKVANEIQGLFLNPNVFAFTIKPVVLLIVFDLL